MGVIRVLPDDQIEELLSTAIIGRIACCDHGANGSSRPYLVPIAYGYDGESIFAHSSPGRKLDFMRAEPLVTFEVDEGSAPDYWRSVIAEGSFEELEDDDARAAALTVMYRSVDAIPELDNATVIFRIRLTAKSGRYERPI